MPRTPAPREVQIARRDLRNFAAMVRRPNNWNGALEGGFARAFRSVLAVEDAHGVDVAADLSDRLTALRQRAGLSPEFVTTTEREAIAAADAAKVTA